MIIMIMIIDLVINHLVKFADRLRDKYVSRQQLWLTNLVRSLSKTGYTSFSLSKRPFVSGAARYRSHVENPHEQFCYLIHLGVDEQTTKK